MPFFVNPYKTNTSVRSQRNVAEGFLGSRSAAKGVAYFPRFLLRIPTVIPTVKFLLRSPLSAVLGLQTVDLARFEFDFSTVKLNPSDTW